MPKDKRLKVIRFWLVLFFLGILFGLHTVVFVEVETAFFVKYLGSGTAFSEKLPFVSKWIDNLYTSVSNTYQTYPVMAYCMDWLSYACVVFAIFMLGAIRHPVRNVWIVEVYMIACLLGAVLPFIAGPFRNVPVFWRFIDSSFGVIGFFFYGIPTDSSNNWKKLNKHEIVPTHNIFNIVSVV